MSSNNEQRRQAAKRKLEKRLEHQQKAARKRKLIIIGSSVAVVVIVAASVTAFAVKKVSDDNEKARWTACAYTPDDTDPLASLPPIEQVPAEQQAEYLKYKEELTAGMANKRTTPMPGDKQLKSGTLDSVFATNQGDLPMTLEREGAPCNVGAFETLIKAGYYNNTSCHRLTTEGIKVLQCGDPTATGAGGPGWSSPDEAPTNLAPAPGDTTGQSVVYPRGTIAVANSGQPNTGASQFFMVIQDSTLAPSYSVIGTVDPAGLEVLDKVAAAGVTPGADGAPATDGKPALPVDISTATITN
ncbi:peptidylprolyl isomerase [Williamsia sp.]|uniref:peptidylprolyl isomerase n=1 Tax=Williamsia sp. TaxID=1872085 RepID=UPI002F945F4F